MSGSPYIYIENTGVIVADTASIQATVQSEWTGVFGADLSVNDETPQGVIITGDTTGRQALVANNALLANQINPNLSGGVFLDAVAALSGLQREAETFTEVSGMVLAGEPGSPIAAGQVAKDQGGNLFNLLNDVTLDAVTGLAIGQYVAQLPGPIACVTGTLSVETLVLGLETITNPGTAVELGTVTQSDEEFRVLRRNTLALQGVSLREAQASALNDLIGVIGSQTLENKSGSPVTISGVTLVARSIWACVDGGSDIDVATSLLENKSYGCDWTGAQTIDVTEPASGQLYVVQFDRPTLIPLVVKIFAKQKTYQGNPLVDIPNVVVQFATNQLPDILGFVVGQNASPFEIGGAVVAQCQGIYISQVQISLKSSISYSTAEIAMLIFQKATVTQTDVTVVLS